MSVDRGKTEVIGAQPRQGKKRHPLQARRTVLVRSGGGRKDGLRHLRNERNRSEGAVFQP